MTPRKPGQFKEIRKLSRNTIITAATKVFSEFGYQATIEMVAKKAGISKGLIYNYFKSKDDLLEAIFMEGFPYFDKILSVPDKNDTALEKLGQVLKTFTRSLQENLTFWKLYQSVMSHPIISSKLTKFKEYYESVFSPLLFSIFQELNGNTMNEMEIQIEILIFASIMDGIAFDYTIMGDDYPLELVIDTIIKKYEMYSVKK
jgi:AcrR family transcriptional regulator